MKPDSTLRPGGTNVDILVTRVTYAFGARGDNRRVMALREVSLDVRPGEFVCLIGPSGCGKSTLLNLMGGLLEPQDGNIMVRGRPVRGPRPQDVAYVFQDNTLFPWRTVLDNVKVGLQFQGVRNAKERDERARAALAFVNLTEFWDYYPDQLSGGMRQRVSLARALSLDTDILLMDEPFAALDEQTRMVLGEELSALLEKAKKTIVFVTHSLSEAAFLADRVAVFTARPGRIKEIIAVDEEHPRKPSFLTSAHCNALRNNLYELLRDEIMATVGLSSSPLDGGMRAYVTGPGEAQ
jgi:NitT/TauT family transport system ATP-binding protein